MFKFKTLYLSEEAKNYPLANEIIQKIKYDKIQIVDKESHPGGGLLLTLNKGAFIKPCPGQKGSVCCGYYVVEWGLGCPFACEYCIIQNYTGARDITLYLNLDDCKAEVLKLREQTSGVIRLGTGQFGDPLALESIFPLNAALIDFTSEFKNFTLEIKSKSSDISCVLNAKNAQHVTLAFSLNPQAYIDRLEHGAAPLISRLKAAALASDKTGCRLAFHFDPILPLDNWQRRYSEVFEMMKDYIQDRPVNWISIGSFRFPKGFQENVEKYHPNSGILSEEFYASADGKMRYFRPFREEIYAFAFKRLKALFADAAVYMCMETPEVSQRMYNRPFCSANLKAMLDSRVASK